MLATIPAGSVTYARMGFRLRREGGRVAAGRFVPADFIAALALASYFALLAITNWPASHAPAEPIKINQVLPGQMLMLGVLGEYLWRALDEARRRPRYLVENLTANARLRPGAGSAEGLTPIAPPAAAATGRA